MQKYEQEYEEELLKAEQRYEQELLKAEKKYEKEMQIVEYIPDLKKEDSGFFEPEKKWRPNKYWSPPDDTDPGEEWDEVGFEFENILGQELTDLNDPDLVNFIIKKLKIKNTSNKTPLNKKIALLQKQAEEKFFNEYMYEEFKFEYYEKKNAQKTQEYEQEDKRLLQLIKILETYTDADYNKIIKRLTGKNFPAKTSQETKIETILKYYTDGIIDAQDIAEGKQSQEQIKEQKIKNIEKKIKKTI